MSDLIRRNDPFTGLSGLHNHIDDIFNEFFSMTPSSNTARVPAMDIYNENDKNIVAEIHAPGFKDDDFDISIENGVLQVRAEQHQKDETKDEDRKYMLRESHSSFVRRIALPKNVNSDNIDAHFEDGVLKVTMPLKDLPKPKKVKIKSKSSKK